MGLRKLIAALIAVAAAPANAHGPSDAHFLGNEGLMVVRGDTKILFDAFYAESFNGTYSLVPDAIETKMIKGDAPYDGVDAIFISHIHPDHFNSRKTIAYMRAHPEVRLYAGIDVVGAIRAADASSDPLMQRVTAVHVVQGAPPAKFDVGGLAIEAFPIPHSGGNPAPNYGFRVTIDGATTVMHMGDAIDDDRYYAPYQKDFDAKRTDVAFPPYWLLMTDSGKKILQQRIKAVKSIGIHVDAAERAHPDQTRKDVGADLFIEPGETRPIP